ncbi:hypothetical protein K443DRAFT_11664 [Laccaria amethystina LaAM-08-1]|uniref:Uncharacterized protein n=1 Tax=Laccaria amethystina LaAM-08-1 TaxID=1095629 RepID=A0A0C9X1A9_9AGAR|nr:hypothetical protein K443DRAFT_11664 [Laccaria amethystina LaAM-08-1]
MSIVVHRLLFPAKQPPLLIHKARSPSPPFHLPEQPPPPKIITPHPPTTTTRPSRTPYHTTSPSKQAPARCHVAVVSATWQPDGEQEGWRRAKTTNDDVDIVIRHLFYDIIM